MYVKIIAIAVLSIVYLYNLLLSVINMRSADNPIPANVADVYDEDTYLKWRSYHAEKTKFGIVTSTVTFVIELILFSCNLYARFAGLFPKTSFMQMFAVFLLSSLASLLLIPFSWYNTMVIEEKYGFNRSSGKTFWADQVKEFLIGLLIMIVIGSLLMWVHQKLGDWLIVAFAGLMMLLVLGVSFLYPVLSRIFNKFVPLEDGELKEKLTGLLERNGYHVRDIKVMDASRRTTKSNAYFTGFGKMKTIVLFDTLVESMTTEEICAVFAHELGHGLHKDTLKNQDFLTDIVSELKRNGIRASVFVDPDPMMVELAAKAGADRVELYTEPYATNYLKSDPETAVMPFVTAARKARECGMGLNAGHDLSLVNLRFLKEQIPWLDEVSIGHALVCDALYLGLEKTISEYKKCII